MKVQAVTDVGRERSVNQDYVYYSLTETGSLPNLFLVADGMGGHKAGDMASRYTVETFVSLVQDSTLKDPVSIINNAVTQVNRRLLQKAAESENYEGMGTTLVAATVYDNILRVANVGDSRLYIFNQEDITQITRDHSLVEEMVSMGEINREQARNHEKKNIITRALGIQDEAQIDLFPFRVETGNRYLLCSDGLTNMVEDTELCRLISQKKDISEIGAELILKANKNGGLDNIAVVLVEIDNSEVGL